MKQKIVFEINKFELDEILVNHLLSKHPEIKKEEIKQMHMDSIVLRDKLNLSVLGVRFEKITIDVEKE